MFLLFSSVEKNEPSVLSGKYIGIKGSRSEIALEIISGQATNTLTTTIASDFSFGKVVSRLNSCGHLNCIAAADCLGGEKCDVIDFLRFTYTRSRLLNLSVLV